MLDRAIKIDYKGRSMISVLNDIIAVFKLTRKNSMQNKNIYHGYVVDWHQITEDAKGVLQEAGLANSKGKLFSQQKCLNIGTENTKSRRRGYCCACRITTR
jgi:hypothetical protein